MPRLLLAKAFARQLSRLLGFTITVFALALGFALTPLSAEKASTAVIAEATRALQPIVAGYVVLNDTAEAARTAAALAGALPGRGVAVYALIGYFYNATCGAETIAPGAVMIGTPSHHCMVVVEPVYALAPVAGRLSSLGLGVAAGHPPRRPGEAALDKPLIQILNATLAGEARIWGIELKVTGVISYTAGFNLPRPPGPRTIEATWGIHVVLLASPGEVEALARAALGAPKPTSGWAAVAYSIASAGIEAGPPPEPPPGPGGTGLVPPPGPIAGAMVASRISGAAPDELASKAHREAREIAEAIRRVVGVEARLVASPPPFIILEPGRGLVLDRGEEARDNAVTAMMHPVTLVASAAALILAAGVGAYAATDAVEAIASKHRALAALLAVRGAPPRSVSRSFTLLHVIAALAAAAAASLLAALMGAGRTAAAGLLALAPGLVALRRASRSIASARPVEALRPVEAEEKGARRRRGRAVGVLTLVSLLPVALGLAGVRPEKLLNWAEGLGGAAAGLAVAALTVSIAFAPVAAPALFFAAVRLAAGLGDAARGVGHRLARALGLPLAPRSPLPAEALAMPAAAAGAAVGASLAAPWLEGVRLQGLLPGSSFSAAPAAAVYRVVGLYAAAALAMIAYGLVASRLPALDATAAAVLVRGASRRQAVALLAAELAPVAVAPLAAGALAGLVLYASTVGVVRFYALLSSRAAAPGLTPTGLDPLPLVAAVLAAAIPPAAAALQLSRPRGLGEKLRRLGMG